MKVIKTNFKYLKPLIPLDPNKVDTIFIHHPASKTATPEQIHQWHLEKGFNGFGYNEYIRKDGTIYIGRGDNVGAQMANYNSKSYGICLEGNYDIEDAPSDELIDIVADRVVQSQKRFFKATNVLPHFARFNTSCPGKNFPMLKLYKAINKIKSNEDMLTVKDDKFEKLEQKVSDLDKKVTQLTEIMSILDEKVTNRFKGL